MKRDPLTRQRSTWEQFDNPGSTVVPWATWWRRRTGDGELVACVADEPRIGWHMSISFRNHRGDLSRYPHWDEIAHARETMLPLDVEFAMLLPRQGDYVAAHPTTFHLHQMPPPGACPTCGRDDE